MPIFEYRCTGCGDAFELLILSSSPAPECPACGGRELEKLMSPPAVSTEHTQRRALDRAKARVDKVKYDREYEAHKAMHDHHD